MPSKPLLTLSASAALEQDEPRQTAQLAEWESAFQALTSATGQSDPEQLAARFLDDDAANFEVYATAGKAAAQH